MSDATLPLVFSRGEALTAGFTRHAVDWRISSGTWRVLRRGVFCRAEVYDGATPEQQHLLAGLALLAGAEPREVLSHRTAALAYGWPAPPEVDLTPWSTLPKELEVATRRRDGRVRQVAPLPDHQVRDSGRVTLTSPVRTVADCLRHLPAEESVPIGDAAVRGGVGVEQVRSVLSWQGDWPYAARGRASLALVDGRRESWLESRSVVFFQRQRLPQPLPQVDIFDERGQLIARVDFLWAAEGVIGEADGWSKYQLPLGVGNELEVLKAEKTREDRLRDLGYEMVRWTGAEILRNDSPLPGRVRRALARARGNAVRGHRRPQPVPAERPVAAAGLQALTGLAASGRLLEAPTAAYSLAPGDLAS